MPGIPAMFLDRDGVIIEDVHYLSRLDQIQLIPGAGPAIRKLNEAGMPVVVVTNQSGVARGLFPESFVSECHQYLAQLLGREGARIDRFYYCPHHFEKGNAPYNLDCDCRKPRPGMLLGAARDLGLDLGQSWMIGDKLSDLSAGSSVGCRTILVRTGHGLKVDVPANPNDLNLEGVAAALPEAIEIYAQWRARQKAA